MAHPGEDFDPFLLDGVEKDGVRFAIGISLLVSPNLERLGPIQAMVRGHIA